MDLGFFDKGLQDAREAVSLAESRIDAAKYLESVLSAEGLNLPTPHFDRVRSRELVRFTWRLGVKVEGCRYVFGHVDVAYRSDDKIEWAWESTLIPELPRGAVTGYDYCQTRAQYRAPDRIIKFLKKHGEYAYGPDTVETEISPPEG